MGLLEAHTHTKNISEFPHHISIFPPVSKKDIHLFLFIICSLSSNSSPSPGPTFFQNDKKMSLSLASHTGSV